MMMIDSMIYGGGMTWWSSEVKKKDPERGGRIVIPVRDW